ncbi:MAG: hypothetical protein CEN90_423 [Parcubacteria group bacterium Licking1014_17]|nr:MAG: hypothetical protein CEN90_423 [Parcubacteria group bacterium Licking1014_17]
MSQTLIIGIVGLVVGMAVAYFLVRRREPKDDKGIEILSQRIESLSNSTSQALRDTLKLVSDQLKESRETVERSSINVHKQVEGFTSGLTQLKDTVKQVHDSVKDVSSFQNIFKSPKLRGIWGESSLEASLNQYFARDNFQLQHYFKSGEAVDAVLTLPNGLLLPVDSKFNWENFEKMVNANSDAEKEQYRKIFFSDVKKKIDEIAAKYILPSEGTTDLALMYVPAETVYYEIISNMKEIDITAYARSKRVILVSPNTFALSISAIRHWLRDIQVGSQTKEIIKRLERITIDGAKLAEDFRRLGKHLTDASGSYNDTEKRLGLMLDRTKNIIELGEKENKEDKNLLA